MLEWIRNSYICNEFVIYNQPFQKYQFLRNNAHKTNRASKY